MFDHDESGRRAAYDQIPPGFGGFDRFGPIASLDSSLVGRWLSHQRSGIIDAPPVRT